MNRARSSLSVVALAVAAALLVACADVWGFGDLHEADGADAGSADGSRDSTDGESGADGATLADAPFVTDGQQDGAPSLDAASPVDASSIVDSAPEDSAPPVDSAPTCTPYPDGGLVGHCAGNGAVINIPSQFCQSNNGDVIDSTSQCEDCIEHYTCACVTMDTTCSGSGPTMCSMVDGVPTIACQ